MGSTSTTLVDRFIAKLRNHWLGASLTILVLGVLLLGKITGALSDITDFVDHDREAIKAEYCSLAAPLVLQLDRTKSAFDRWNKPDLSLELTIRDGNTAARELLLQKAGLIPTTLRADADSLIRHYDLWLEEYDKRRVRNPSGPMEPYVFV